ALIRVLPVFILVLGPIMLFFKLGAVAVGATPPIAMLAGLPVQIAFGITFCLAAARKVLRADVQAFGPWLGLVLLIESIVISLGAIYWTDDLARASGIGVIREMPRDLIFFATVLLLAIVSFIPIAAAAQAAGRWERRRRFDPIFQDRAP